MQWQGQPTEPAQSIQRQTHADEGEEKAAWRPKRQANAQDTTHDPSWNKGADQRHVPKGAALTPE